MPSTIDNSRGILSALAFVICLSVQPALAGSDAPPAGATQLTSAEIEKLIVGNTWVYRNDACLSGCNPHPLYVECAVKRHASGTLDVVGVGDNRIGKESRSRIFY